MTIKQIKENIHHKLQVASRTPGLDARIIVGHALDLDPSELLLADDRILTTAQIQKIEELTVRRLNKTPIAYITGSKEFFGLPFVVTSDVLIPRPETELLVERIIDISTPYDRIRIADIGTGSGCIAISLAYHLPKAYICGIDISDRSLQIAQKNGILILGEKPSPRWIQGNLLNPIEQEDRYHIMVANLPYLDPNKYTDDSIQAEPPEALFSEDLGLWHYKNLITYLSSHLFLIPDYLLIEINPEQKDPLSSYARERLPVHTMKSIPDLSGQIRHLEFQFLTNR